MLTREQIQKEIEEMNEWIPIHKIEERCGMPPTTLQKVLKGTRELPKKWHKKLEAYFVVNSTPIPEKEEIKLPLTEKECFDSEKLPEDFKDEGKQWEEVGEIKETQMQKMQRLLIEEKAKIKQKQ